MAPNLVYDEVNDPKKVLKCVTVLTLNNYHACRSALMFLQKNQSKNVK